MILIRMCPYHPALIFKWIILIYSHAKSLFLCNLLNRVQQVQKRIANCSWQLFVLQEKLKKN